MTNRPLVLRSSLHSEATTTKPVATAGSGAGASPTVTNKGADERGQVSVTVGSTGEAAGTLVTLAFATKYDSAPEAVIVSANDSATAALAPYASATTTTLTIGVHNAPSASATYVFNYAVIGGV